MNDSETKQRVAEQNAEILDRQYCTECSTSVRQREYPHKFMAAGGAMTGPFCSVECFWNRLLEVGPDDTTSYLVADDQHQLG